MDRTIFKSIHLRNRIKTWLNEDQESRPTASAFAKELGDPMLKDELEHLDKIKVLCNEQRESETADAIAAKSVRQKLIKVLVAHCFGQSPELQLKSLFNIVETNDQIQTMVGSPFPSLPSSDNEEQVETREDQYRQFGFNLIDCLESLEKWRGATFILALAYIDLMHTWQVDVKDSNESIAEDIAKRLCLIYGLKTSKRSLERVYSLASKTTQKIAGEDAPDVLSKEFPTWWRKLLENIATRAPKGPRAFQDLAEMVEELPDTLKNQIGLAGKQAQKKPARIDRVSKINALSEQERAKPIRRELKRLSKTVSFVASLQMTGVEIDAAVLDESIKAARSSVQYLESLKSS